MATSRDKYYREMFKTLSYYNDHKNMSLSNVKIQEAIGKVIKESSIADANNVTAYTFSHTSNTQRDNANAIFASKKLDKLENLADAVNYLTINGAIYYESNTETASDTQGDLTLNLETITHTSNGNFEQKLLRKRTIYVLPPVVNPGIEQEVALILLAPQTILAPTKK